MHKSVLLDEVIENLNIKENGTYLDLTLGYGGHSKEILKRINKGYLFAFDQDDEYIEHCNKSLSLISNNFTIIKSNFVNMKKVLKEKGIESVDGILFDLGVSSMQLDNDYRGFSYHNDAALDMRMDRSSKVSAYNVVNEYSPSKLIEIFYKYGEEKASKKIAMAIVKRREEKKIETTLELVEVIKSCLTEKEKRLKHPAKKIFQAIRIEVNNELGVFETTLHDAISMLKAGGRICVITFHSLEDRICKHIFKSYTEISPDLINLPTIPSHLLPKYKLITKKGIKATSEEVQNNNRSRSAVLRVIERI